MKWAHIVVPNAHMNTGADIERVHAQFHCGTFWIDHHLLRPSEEPEPGPAPGVPDLVELEPAEEGADDEVALDLLLLVPPLDHAVLEEAEVGDDPSGEVGVEHGALAEDLEVHREVEAAAEQDGVL